MTIGDYFDWRQKHELDAEDLLWIRDILFRLRRNEMKRTGELHRK